MSLAFHVAILVALYSITQVTYSGQDSTELDSLFQEFDAENYSFDSVVVETMGNQSDLNEPSPSQAASTSLSTTPQQEVQKRLDEKVLRARLRTPAVSKAQWTEWPSRSIGHSKIAKRWSSGSSMNPGPWKLAAMRSLIVSRVSTSSLAD